MNMSKLLLVSALAGVLIAANGQGFAQQPAPGGGAQPATCGQMAASCNSSCESVGGPRHRECQTVCQAHRAECMATGFWKNISTGQLLPKRKE